MRLAKKGGALLAAALLAACSQNAPAALPHRAAGIDQQAIAAQIKQRLENRVWYSFGEDRPCSSAFIVGQPTITGQHIEGSSGEVEATLVITSRRDWPERSDPTDGCFGSPAGGFGSGQTMTYTRTYPVQKWDTGWRLGPGL